MITKHQAILVLEGLGAARSKSALASLGWKNYVEYWDSGMWEYVVHVLLRACTR
jgi:hypothetical protein